MAKFDVYPNPNVAVRGVAPSVVDLQHDVLEGLDTRLVALISRMRPPTADVRIHIAVTVKGEALVANLQALAAIPKARLGHPVAQLSDLRGHVGKALDLILFGFP